MMRVSYAIEAIFRYRTKHKANNYSDDFLFITLLKLVCNNLVRDFLSICNEIYFSVSMDKTEWATKLTLFLGMLLDTENQLILIQIKKKECALRELKYLKSKRIVTVVKLQQITSFLNHLCKSLFPARAYTRRFYSKTNGLKQHHHVTVDSEMKLDCDVWIDFLQNDPKSVCRPFVDLSESLKADEIAFFSDAAGKTGGGIGCIFDTHWCYAFGNPTSYSQLIQV